MTRPAAAQKAPTMSATKRALITNAIEEVRSFRFCGPSDDPDEQTAPPHHWHLWINLAAAGDQDTVRSPRNDFQRCGDLRRTPATRGAVRGELCGSSLLV